VSSDRGQERSSAQNDRLLNCLATVSFQLLCSAESQPAHQDRAK
jgi:hypothetical protein